MAQRNAVEGQAAAKWLSWTVGVSPREAIVRAVDRLVAYARSMVDRQATEPTRALLEFRKSTRRLRALLKFLKGVLPPEERKGLSRRLKEITRITTGRRDTDAVLRAIDELPDTALQLEIGKRLRAEIEEGTGASADGAESCLDLREVLPTLESVAPALDNLLPPDLSLDDLHAAFAESHRRAREALDDVLKDETPRAIHEWRKLLKELRYHAELLREAPGADLETRCEDLTQLARQLGRVTDMFLVSDMLRALGRRLRGLHPKRHARELQQLAIRRFQALATSHAELFALESADFVKASFPGADQPRSDGP